MTSIESRVVALEYQNGRLKATLAVLTLVFAASFLLAQSKGGPDLLKVKVVEAERVVVKDSRGKTRATLGMSGYLTPYLEFTDGDGGRGSTDFFRPETAVSDSV